MCFYWRQKVIASFVCGVDIRDRIATPGRVQVSLLRKCIEFQFINLTLGSHPRVPMGKRKAEELEHEDQGLNEGDFCTGMDSEEEGEASSDLNESAEENLSQFEEFGGEFSGEEDADPVGREEEGKEHHQGVERSTPFSRAFGKIMMKRVPESAITEISGPVLAGRKQLLVRKFEESENEVKGKISGKEEKRELREKGHVLPLIYTNAKEKALMKIATKGVVRLFNAVCKAQTVQAAVDVSSSKTTKATSKQSEAAFMTELRSSSKRGLKENRSDETPGQDGKEGEPQWAVLRTDFMLSTTKKFMDWDKDVAGSRPVT